MNCPKCLAPYEVVGDPKDLASAEALAKEDRYQFEWWALSLVGARPGQDRKKGADTGIDGYIYFFDDKSGQARKIVVQVKSGGIVGSSVVRDLKGVLERERAEIAILVSLQEPTAPMRKEASSAGFYTQEHLREKYPRLQILTIAELLAGKRPEYPHSLAATFRKAKWQEKGQGGPGKRLL